MKQLISLMLTVFTFINVGYAGGGRTHIFMAQEAINKIPDKNLRLLLEDNLDAYLVGAYFPDSGYTKETYHGDAAHEKRFQYKFLEYIYEKYKNPVIENPKLV